MTAKKVPKDFTVVDQIEKKEKTRAKNNWRECPVCESPAVFQTGACYTCYVCGNSSGSCG